MKTGFFKVLAAGMAALIMGAALTAPVHAQIFGGDDDEDVIDAAGNVVWDKKKLERLDRNVRKLERSVARLEGKNAPTVLIEPDPEVVALQATVDILARKVEDQGAVIQRQTQQIEQLQYENRQLQTQVNAQNARFDQLSRRIDVAEAHMKDIDAALAGPPPPPSSLGAPDLDFEQAFSLLTSGKVEDAERAFVSFTETWPEAPQLPEAWYRLGQIRGMKGDNSGSVAAYATSLKGWPKTSWAPDATVRLAEALTNSNRPTEACATLGQFDKLYGKSATVDAKSLAKNLRTRNKCPA